MTSTDTGLRSYSPANLVARSVVSSILAGLRRAFAALHAYRTRKVFMRHAARLDDHLLRDIGLERDDVVEAAPFVSGYEGLEIGMRRR